jgi:diguanylate cyclase (GGDEF)-like protein
LRPTTETVDLRSLLSRAASLVSRFKLSRTSVSALVTILLLVVIQRIGFEVLGTGRSGTLFVDALMALANMAAIGCCVTASRRGHGLSRVFWLLFAIASTLELIPNAGWAYYHYFNITVRDAAMFPSLFYRLAAAPMAIALFLSDEVRRSKLESLLDGCMVVGLVGVTTYQVQMAELTSHDPKIWQLITIGAAVNAVMALVAMARYSLSAPGPLRGLFGRQAIYLSIYLTISFITSFGDAYLPNVDASVDLLWILPYLAASALAVTWRPLVADDRPQAQRISRRTSLLCFNLTLATMVLGSAVLGLRLVDSARVIGLIAVSIVLFSFAVRSAFMQDTQEKYFSELLASRAELQRQALYDELTGLPNRRLLAERLAQMLAIAEREGQVVALFCLDLDGFKQVNDEWGHAIGDLLLNRVAHRMLARARKSDTLARMGGDEFTWLVAHLLSEGDAARLAEGMLQSLSEPYEIEDHAISITASIGISLFPKDSTDPAGLIQRADSAMYAAKREGKNGVRYYSPESEPV